MLLSRLMSVSTWFIPFPGNALWDGEKGAQAPSVVYCETDEDRTTGKITLWSGVRIVVCQDGRVYAGTANGINWQIKYTPLPSETMQVEGKTWQVLIDSTGRDLWIEKEQYEGLVALATTANGGRKNA